MDVSCSTQNARQGVLDHIPETIPENILKQYNLPSRKTALVWIHMPKRIRRTSSTETVRI